MPAHYCMRCMNKLFPGVSVCPYCGTPYQQAPKSPNALKPGYILKGKYLIGTVLGQGGFGITYVGMDLLLEKKVAVKEYFPISSGMVKRTNGASVAWNSEINSSSALDISMQSFLKEARKMAKMDNIPSVVRVLDFFCENNTAYIVMDYIEGETLLEKLQREGVMTFSQCVSTLKPIMQALDRVHQHGIIHRDISPDNIMIQENGNMMLLDLGAAKEVNIQKRDGTIQSSQLIAKEGFSPLEQYTSNGHIDTWTDVYAMCATIYYCCTGKLPPIATARIDNAALPSHPALTKEQLNVLQHGMALHGRDRIQTMSELLYLLEKVASSNSKADPVSVDYTKFAGIVFGVEALVLLYMTYATNWADSFLILRAVGYLLIATGLLSATSLTTLLSCGSAAVCISYWFTGTLAGWPASAAYLCTFVLLVGQHLNLSGCRSWLNKYWFIPTTLLCIYIAMFCAESFALSIFLMDILVGCALTFTMYKLASVKK